ncbi:MAG: TolC family protein [Petrimonas sp.]|nr:TolC family protein [Petrimonas sp.]
MKTYIIALFCTLSFGASAQKALTLQECIDIALQNNRNIKQQELTRQSREIAYAQARADLLPTVNGQVGQNFSFGRSLSVDNTYQSTNSSQTSFGVGANVTLFDGMRMKHNIDARRFDMQASEADLAKIEDDIVMSVSTAFLQALMNKELLRIAEEQVKLTDANIERRKALIQNGKMAQGELYELEAQAAKEELNRVQAENNLKLSLLDLAQIMDMPHYEEMDVVAPPNLVMDESPLLSANAVYESALLARPEIQAAQFRLQSSEKEVKMAESGYYPTLSFGANMGSGYYNMSGRTNDPFSTQLKNNLSQGLGFTLSIPIFNKFQVKNSVKNAEIALENTRIEIDKTKLELRKRIETAYYNALAAQSRWKAADKAIKANEEAFRFAEQKYENGRATSYELFQAKNNLTQALSEETQSKYEYAFRLKILELLKN